MKQYPQYYEKTSYYIKDKSFFPHSFHKFDDSEICFSTSKLDWDNNDKLYDKDIDYYYVSFFSPHSYVEEYEKGKETYFSFEMDRHLNPIKLSITDRNKRWTVYEPEYREYNEWYWEQEKESFNSIEELRFFLNNDDSELSKKFREYDCLELFDRSCEFILNQKSKMKEELENGTIMALVLLSKYELSLDKTYRVKKEHISNATRYINCSETLKTILKEFDIEEITDKQELDSYTISYKVIDNFARDVKYDEENIENFITKLEDLNEDPYFTLYINYEKFINNSFFKKLNDEEKAKYISFIKNMYGLVAELVEKIEQKSKGSFYYQEIKQFIAKLNEIKEYADKNEWKYYIIDLIIQLPSEYNEVEVTEEVNKLFKQYFN